MKSSITSKIITKVCFNCKIEKPVTEFYRSNVRYFQQECKVCNYERKYKWHHTEEGKISSANTKLKRRFGITIVRYNELLKQQNGKCLICGAVQSVNGHKLAVDHNHQTGQIRGLLCKACNVGIGNLRERSDLLRKAADYLEINK